MTSHSIELRTRIYVKGSPPFVRNLSNKYENKFLETATRTGINAAKTAPKKVVHKTAEFVGEFIVNKMADKIVKPKPTTCYSTREKRRNTKGIKTSVIKCNTTKYPNYQMI